MRLCKIAIVGRPNVGKSSLMNMLAGRKVSITDDTPGTTRDRVSSVVVLETLAADASTDPSQRRKGGRNLKTQGAREALNTRPPITVEMIDTGGFGVYTATGRQIDDAGKDLSALTNDIESQIAKAVHHADLILFVIDAQAGVTPMDETVARLLRQGGLGAIDEAGKKNAPAGHKVTMVANKSDGPKWETHALEAAALGFGEPLVVSAKNNYRRREFVERLYELVDQWYNDQLKVLKKGGKKAADLAEPEPEMKLAIVGKRNAGKSTLVNVLAGEQRVIVSEIAGTTRDAIDVRFEMDGRAFVAIDTAGLRRKRSFNERIEWWALERMEMAIDRSDVALLMIDATEPVGTVDQTVGMMLADRYKPVVIVINKWDMVEGEMVKTGPGRGKPLTPEVYEKYLREELKGLWYAPIAFISAMDGTNVHETIDLAFEMHRQSQERVTTGKLNRLLGKIVERQGPPSRTGARGKVLYVSQVATQPPTIVMVVNQPDLFSNTYQRFLLNRLREESPFTEVPIKLVIRDRKKQAEVQQQLAEQKSRSGEDRQKVEEPIDMDAIEVEEERGTKRFKKPAVPASGKPAAKSAATPRPSTSKITVSDYFDEPVRVVDMSSGSDETFAPASKAGRVKAAKAAQEEDESPLEPVAKPGKTSKTGKVAKVAKKVAKTAARKKPEAVEEPEMPMMDLDDEMTTNRKPSRKLAAFDPNKPRSQKAEKNARSRKRSAVKPAN
jgi:GTPase